MTALIILAAGESSRLGKPKQNLMFNGQTLLQRAVKTGLQSACATVIVVLGANAKQIEPIPDVAILHNKDWKDGMASSIKRAISEIDRDTTFDKVIIMLCDQPFVTAQLLDKLIDKQKETGKPIVACSYQGVTGVPALFDSALFAELLQLQGNQGAKEILKQNSQNVAAVPFEKGSIDIDTPEDYENLLSLSN